MKTRPVKCAPCVTKECRDDVDCFDGKSDPRPHLDEENLRILRTASAIEAEHYLKLTRLEELIAFAKGMGYRRIGIAFCIGMDEEARTLHKILAKHFTVYSACCKNFGLDKDEFHLEKIRKGGAEPMCNPVGQALLLASKKTELNVALGLCMGHDILFQKHSAAPVTTIAVKDRVLAHNPLGALYSGYHLKNRFGVTRGRAKAQIKKA